MSILKLTAFRKLLVILLILFCNFVKAQTDINTSFSDRMNYIVQQLEKSRIPNGLLLDYAMEFAKMSNYDGTSLTDSNKVMTSEFWEIYNTLYLSRIHPNGFTIQSPSVFDSLWFNQRDTGKIVLAGMFYNYSRFRDDAVQNNLITIQGEQVIDRYVNGVWQNPYQAEKVFAISPSLEFYQGKNLQVVLPSNLWQTNAAGSVSNISIDLGDGQGYRTLTIGQPLNLNYADTGIKIWKYRLQLSGGQYLYSHSQVRIKNAVNETTDCAGCRFGNSNPETIPFTADEAFQGTAGRGFITIRYRDADLGLRRPLIVVEGFDAGHITNPELRFGNTTINDFYDNVDAFNSNSFDLDDVIRNFPEYDIIYVDWRNGTDFLQRNGRLLETIIQWVNANKEPLPGGGFADNVILGISMGGVISRWALRDMETRLGLQHNTRMYISMDAPQQGANAPVSYQHLIKHVRSIYLQTNVWGVIEIFQFFTNGVSPFRALSIADRPASRQMLINWVDGSGNIDNTMHDQWQAELRNSGYPIQDNIRNIAISNGTECGTTQPFIPGAELLNLNGKANTRFLGDLLGQIAFPLTGILLGQGGFYLGLLPGRNDIKYEFIANAQPQQGVTQRIYRGKISYTKRFLWLIPITVTITERNNNNNSSLLPTDYYGGGEINTGININDVNFQNALIKFNLNFNHIPTFCFVPTPSSLDIGLNNITLNHSDYLARYIGGAPPIPPKNSPFQNFVTAFNNQRRNEHHADFFQRNGNWAAQELTQTGNPPPNPPIVNCSAFCENGTIAGNDQICTTEIYIAPFGNGALYNWSVSNPALVTISPIGNTLQVTKNSGANGSLTITVMITGDCGNATLTKTVLVGNITTLVGRYYLNGEGQAHDLITYYGGINYIPSNAGYCSVFIDNPGLESATWSLVSGYVGGWTQFTEGANPILLLFPPYGDPVTFRLSNTNACGTYYFDVLFAGQSGYGGYYSISPNPTTSTLTISVDEAKLATQKITKSSDQDIREIVILDKTGMVQLKQTYSIGTRQLNMNVSVLRPGVYIVRIFNGKNWTAMKLIKE